MPTTKEMPYTTVQCKGCQIIIYHGPEVYATTAEVAHATRLHLDVCPARVATVCPFPPADVFIETGFGTGETLERACLEPYRVLHSIDVNPVAFDQAWKRFWAQGERVRFHVGSSADILPTILDPARSTTFWLDAHYAAGRHTGTLAEDRQLAATYGECPLLAELRAIVAVPWQTPPIILIDDVWCFQGVVKGTWAEGIDPAQWPTEAQIRAVLCDYDLTVERDRYYRATWRTAPPTGA